MPLLARAQAYELKFFS